MKIWIKFFINTLNWFNIIFGKGIYFIIIFNLLINLYGINNLFSQSHYTINVSGMTFTPDTLVCLVGDTITINPGGYHNAVEVDDSTWMTNGTNSNGGFNIPLGTPSGSFVIDQAKTYYYVCTPHVTLGMKGVIISSSPAMIYGCTDSLACNFDATATVEIPKPKNFFSGTPKPTPETIANGISIAKQKVLQKYIGKCITERSKLDQYLKVKDRVDSQVNNFINIIKSKQTQDKLTLNVKIRANVNGNLFDSILFSGANNANNETSKKTFHKFRNSYISVCSTNIF